MKILVLSKRQYTNRDVIDDRFGRLWEIPLQLARAGNDVTCLCLNYRGKGGATEYVEETSGRPVRWISIDLGRTAVAGFCRFLATANRLIKRDKPDVVWSCSDSIYAILGASLTRKHGIVSAIDLYDNFEYFGFYKVPLVGALFRRAVRNADVVTCVSRNLARRIRDVYGRTKPVVVVTNAVDTEQFKPMNKAECREQLGLPREAMLIGAAGDISNYRGADMMYRAISEGSEGMSGAQLVVAGYRDQQTEIPDAKTVHDLGMLPPHEIPRFLNALDVAVVYNRTSTFGDYCFPQKFFEILACNVPLVAARVGELSALLEDYDELLYDDGDLGSFVAAVKRQLEHRRTPDIMVATWNGQAERVQEHLTTAIDAQRENQ